MSPRPSSATRLLALLGWPARHSLSPALHNAALREQGLDLVYLALPTPPDHLETVVTALGAVEAVGANVTVPHKETVARLCDRLTTEAELVGAVNTLAWTADGLLGDNTDARGVERVLADEIGVGPAIPTLVVGTGGAARAVVVALGRLGAPVTVAGRRAEASDELAALADRCGAQGARTVDVRDEDELARAAGDVRLVVNATPLGMAGEALPDPLMRLRSDQVAYDLVYSPPETPFLRAARGAGAGAVHGLGMLVAQAAASYRLWTGHDAPEATMSAVALAALAPGHEPVGTDPRE